jgi:hypothetical protein
MESPGRERILLVELNGGDDNLLRERLLESGFLVASARNRTELCLKLLTWRPDLVVGNGDLRAAEIAALANLIRSSAPVAVPVVFVCHWRPRLELQARVLRNPAPFADLVSLIQSTLASCEAKRSQGYGRAHR